MTLTERIDQAIDRIIAGHSPQRIPADLTDPDIVLTDCKARIAELEAELADAVDYGRGRHEAEQALATVTMGRDEARADFAAVVSELECEPTREDAVAEILRRERLYDEARASEARMREALERSVSTIHARCRLVAPYLPGGAACDELCCVISAALSTPASDWLAARDRRVAEMQRADDIANLTKFREGFEEGMGTGYMTMPKHAARDMLLTLEGLFETEPLVTFKPEGET